jgi:hypothetical protein
LDPRNIRHVQRQGRYTIVGIFERAARSRIYFFGSPFQRLIDECSANATIGAGDQDCLVFNLHNLFLFEVLFFCLLFTPLAWQKIRRLLRQGTSAGSPFGRHVVSTTSPVRAIYAPSRRPCRT